MGVSKVVHKGFIGGGGFERWFIGGSKAILSSLCIAIFINKWIQEPLFYKAWFFLLNEFIPLFFNSFNNGCSPAQTNCTLAKNIPVTRKARGALWPCHLHQKVT
jgi:hypothetical protein